MPVKPITPDEVTARKAAILPSEVLTAFNGMIAENWNGSESSFKQDAVLRRILAHFGNHTYTRQKVLDNHWLDVEPIFQDAGWEVKYDSPAYNETFAASFTFRRKRPV